MKDLALIDSSIRIGFLRGHERSRELLGDRLKYRTAALCSITWFELYVGVRGKREMKILEQLKHVCIWLEMDSMAWLDANRIGTEARKSGFNCPTADILIAACAKRHGVALIHQDKHFDRLMMI